MNGPGLDGGLGLGNHRVEGEQVARRGRRAKALIRAALHGAMEFGVSGKLPVPALALRSTAAAIRAGALLLRARQKRSRNRAPSVPPTVESIEQYVEDGILLPGDVLAFSGKSRASRLIRAFTFSRISHVGIAYDSMTIVESTSMRGFTGVVKHPISDLADYPGKIWRLRLIENLSEDLDPDQLGRFLDAQVGKRYDFHQAAMSGIDWFWRTSFETERDFAKWFCSELVTAALSDQGVISPSYNPSEATPADVWRWNIWGTKRALDRKLLRDMREPGDEPVVGE